METEWVHLQIQLLKAQSEMWTILEIVLGTFCTLSKCFLQLKAKCEEDSGGEAIWALASGEGLDASKYQSILLQNSPLSDWGLFDETILFRTKITWPPMIDFQDFGSDIKQRNYFVSISSVPISNYFFWDFFKWAFLVELLVNF